MTDADAVLDTMQGDDGALARACRGRATATRT